MRDHDFGNEAKNVERMVLSIHVPGPSRVIGILHDIRSHCCACSLNLRPARAWDTVITFSGRVVCYTWLSAMLLLLSVKDADKP